MDLTVEERRQILTLIAIDYERLLIRKYEIKTNIFAMLANTVGTVDSSVILGRQLSRYL